MSNQQPEVFQNGPMTIQRSYSNIVGALNLARQKGLFSFRDSAFIFTSLQKMEEFIKQHEKSEPKTGPKLKPTPPNVPKVFNIIDRDDEPEKKQDSNVEKQPFAELLDNDNNSTNKENEEEEEIIEI